MVEAGVLVVCLSNGARDSTEPFLRRAGLQQLVDEVLSVPEVRKSKPPPEVYRYALERAARPTGEVALIAVHAFDCRGPHAMALTTGWAPRLERHHGKVHSGRRRP